MCLYFWNELQWWSQYREWNLKLFLGGYIQWCQKRCFSQTLHLLISQILFSIRQNLLGNCPPPPTSSSTGSGSPYYTSSIKQRLLNPYILGSLSARFGHILNHEAGTLLEMYASSLLRFGMFLRIHTYIVKLSNCQKVPFVYTLIKEFE